MKSMPANRARHRPLGNDAQSLRQSLIDRLTFIVGKDTITATTRDWFQALAYVVRDRLIARWMETMRSYYRADAKRVYYLSLEFLMGRVLRNSLLNLGILEQTREALAGLDLDLDEIADLEPDAALGNGGLGRLAACFLDSMAALGLPGYGYGIRYEYGMFYQRIENGYQVEHPENWLRYGNPWEFPRAEVLFPVKFGGRVVEFRDEAGRLGHHWVDTEEVMAMAFDTPIPGYRGRAVNNLRLWSAKSSRDFDLHYFNEGNYIKAVEHKNYSENLSRVLYPDDTTSMGRELRLKQQYFFVSASLQDILFRFRKSHSDWRELPQRVAIQLNDTHPALAIPELLRILLDEQGLDWESAWGIVKDTFSYTNHTLMPEALEVWPVSMLEAMLPRHLQIIYEINHRLLARIRASYPGDVDLLRRMSLVQERPDKGVRMAYLALVASHKVNGVAELHTRLMRETLFADFHRADPERIVNVTNGIAPRRWLQLANPGLAELISTRIGKDWKSDLEQLAGLRPLAEDAGFRAAFAEVKRANKERLAATCRGMLGIDIDLSSLFDVQVKRIHEYKRQLLNVLHVIARYNRIRDGLAEPPPRTVIFSGKAAPGYNMAKLIIKLIGDVAEVVNNDVRVGERLKVVFVPNYDVSTAMLIIPAADLSEQISTAGTEASGTGNMKLALNGALTIGTLDGANIEIRAKVGEDNMFIFGVDAAEAEALRASGYVPREYYEGNAELRRAVDLIGSGFFSPDNPNRYQPLVEALLGSDRYLVLRDFDDYLATQDRIDASLADADAWSRMAICNVAGMGSFSSDRAVLQYARDVWNAAPVEARKKSRARQE